MYFVILVIYTLLKRDMEILWLIKTITKFPTVIGYHQPDLSSVSVILVIGQPNITVKGTSNKSCLCKWSERVMCIPPSVVFDCCFLFKTYN